MSTRLDPIALGVMANQLDGITREMTNTMIRTTRSTTMASRDFSCSITSSEHDLISCPEGLPVHVFGSSLIAQSMQDLHPDFQEGDAFLHNDPYAGNSHAADHTIMVPVFFEGEHVFTTCSKAHQNDIGNALPSTYMPRAQDVYEEGALIFPCVRIQSNYRDVDDIVRMCKRRIRAPETWYGDYLASVGAGRLAERRLKELCAKFGLPTVREFVAEWLDYCERMAADAIAKLPALELTARTALDPFPGLPEGIPLNAQIEVDPEAGKVVVDLRDNPDCTPTGLNLSESTAKNSATTAVLMVLNSHREAKGILVPNNSGSYRRIEVRLRENCVVGIPRHPASCSVATNTVADRVVAMITAGFATALEGSGMAEPCFGSPPFQGVVSGWDRQRERPYILQLFSGTSGGPATAESDGWLAFINTAGAGLAYVDSTEVVEQKYPMVVWEKVVRKDSEGAGELRGAPGNVSIYGPRFDDLRSHYMLDGVKNPPQGVRGGGPALGPEVWVAEAETGEWARLHDTVGDALLNPGKSIVSLSAGGGGYGDPFDRDPQLVLRDVVDGYISVDRARDAYGVAIAGDAARWETLEVDEGGTRKLRASDVEAVANTRHELPKAVWWPPLSPDGMRSIVHS